MNEIKEQKLKNHISNSLLTTKEKRSLYKWKSPVDQEVGQSKDKFRGFSKTLKDEKSLKIKRKLDVEDKELVIQAQREFGFIVPDEITTYDYEISFANGKF